MGQCFLSSRQGSERRRTNFCDYHGHDQHAGRVFEPIERENALANGGGDLLSQGNGTDKLGDGGQDARLDQGERTRAHGGGVRVGYILWG